MNNPEQKKLYQTPIILRTDIDAEISLNLQSNDNNPPGGPNETFLLSSSTADPGPFKII